ncbi:MAG: HAD-IIIA family hydrolase, partial [Caldimicrobium sp.]
HDYQKQDCECRKPKVGMALQAKKDFPEIDFSKSIIVGDSREDIELGRKLGMITVYIEQDLKNPFKAHLCFDSLLSFSRAI